MSARLLDYNDRHRRGVLSPLFDVRLVKMTEGGMLLQGYLIKSERVGGQLITTEYAQGWWAKYQF